MSSCFGTYSHHFQCDENCSLLRQCKAFLVSDGFDIAASVVETLEQNIAKGVEFPDADWAAVQWQVLLNSKNLPRAPS